MSNSSPHRHSGRDTSGDSVRRFLASCVIVFCFWAVGSFIWKPNPRPWQPDWRSYDAMESGIPRTLGTHEVHAGDLPGHHWHEVSGKWLYQHEFPIVVYRPDGVYSLQRRKDIPPLRRHESRTYIRETKVWHGNPHADLSFCQRNAVHYAESVISLQDDNSVQSKASRSEFRYYWGRLRQLLEEHPSMESYQPRLFVDDNWMSKLERAAEIADGYATSDSQSSPP